MCQIYFVFSFVYEIALKIVPLEFSSGFLMPALCTFLESDNRAIYAMEHRPGTWGLLIRLHTKQLGVARAALQCPGVITTAIKLTQIIYRDFY